MSVTKLAMKIGIVTLGVAMMHAASFAQQAVNLKDKRVLMIIGSEPGGGTDAVGRLVAPFLSKHLPGNPNVVVQNMPGAGGVVSLRYFETQVAADGLTITTSSSTQVDPLLYRKPGANYNPTKYLYVGGIGRGGQFLLINKEAEARLYDKKKQPLVMGSISAPRSGVQMALWGIEYLGWNARWVTAYRGTSELFLALERGEIDMTASANYQQVERALATGKFKVLVQSGTFEDGKLVPRPELKDSPTLSTMMEGKLKDDTARKAFAYWIATISTDKWIALPPNTPANIVSTYRESFTKLAGDPEFIEQGKKSSADFTSMSARDVEELVQTLDSTPDAAIGHMTQMMRNQGIQVE